MSDKKSVIDMRAQVDRASNEEIAQFLERVISWPVNYNDPNELRRRDEAREHLEAVRRSQGSIPRARVFLHKLAEQAGARGGWKVE